MKSVMLFFCLSISTEAAYGQTAPTLSETQEWILNKLSHYAPNPKREFVTSIYDEPRIEYKDTIIGKVKFYFRLDSLVREETYEYSYEYHTDHFTDPSRKVDRVFTARRAIPLWSIKAIISNSNALELQAECRCVYNNEGMFPSNSFRLLVRGLEEDNFEARLEKAFLYLRSFYPKPLSTEKF